MFSLKQMWLAGAMVLATTSLATADGSVTLTGVNQRSGPGTQYKVVTTIPAGADLSVGSCSGGWCEVEYSGNHGWVSASYLKGGSAQPQNKVVPNQIPAPARKPITTYKPPQLVYPSGIAGDALQSPIPAPNLLPDSNPLGQVYSGAPPPRPFPPSGTTLPRIGSPYQGLGNLNCVTLNGCPRHP